jgi:DNA-binding NarL/FixJ family response regulator
MSKRIRILIADDRPVVRDGLAAMLSTQPDFDVVAQAASGQDIPESLTERETEVLNLLAKGRTNKEIAETLVITERTVKFHVSAILTKLGASNRTEAVPLQPNKI